MKYLYGFLIVISMLLSTEESSAQKKLTLDDIYRNNLFQTRSVAGVNWMKDSKFYTAQDDKGIQKYNSLTGLLEEHLFSLSENGIDKFAFDDYALSADETKILLLTNRKEIYRRSFTAEYYIYDIATKSLVALSKQGAQSYATFSPDGTKVAFVRANNLFYKDLITQSEIQITTDGKLNSIINGAPDWVYEEEFYLSTGFQWSGDSKKIAFYRFDETDVKEFTMQLWNGTEPYPQNYQFKYPKAGEKNSVVSVKVYDLTNQKTINVNTGKEKDVYLPRIKWTKNPEILSIIRLNRAQNKLEILHADLLNKDTYTVLTEISDTYIDLNYCDDLTYLDNGTQFLYSSEIDGYKHLYLYSMKGEKISQITAGAWEVTEIVGVAQSKAHTLIYYLSTEDSPLERHLYSININGKDKKKLTRTAGVNQVKMSPDCKYFMLYHSSTLVLPSVSLWETAKNLELKRLEDNKALQATISQFELGQKELFTFKTPENITLNGFMIKPKNYEVGKKYPTLFYVYGGPGSQQVLNEWGGRNFMWHQYLAQEGYVVVCIDNRGTDGRGAAFKKCTYKNLGKLETADQIAAANYLIAQGIADENRIGIWGWSYGGYMSSLCLLLGNDVFKMAIAVAPVTSWRFYDSIYTERFLGKPQDNPQGYDDYSPITHTAKLKGKLLVVHGTGDDNVHFQNTIALQEALIKEGKHFDSFFYPNRNHSIGGGKVRMHLYQMLTKYVTDNL